MVQFAYRIWHLRLSGYPSEESVKKCARRIKAVWFLLVRERQLGMEGCIFNTFNWLWRFS